MKRKKFLALALAGVMTAATLTACAPLEDLYDWFFGSGSSKASHGSQEGVVKESDVLENQLRTRFGLSETTASDRAKQTLEEVAEKFDATWLTENRMNETAKDALVPITQDKLQEGQELWVDVIELTPSGETAFDTSGDRKIYLDEYKYVPPVSGYSYHNCYLVFYSNLEYQLTFYNEDGVELYAGTFQKNGKNTPQWLQFGNAADASPALHTLFRKESFSPSERASPLRHCFAMPPLP